MLGVFQNDRLVGLDSGSVWGGALTALVIHPDQEASSRLLMSVDCQPPS